MNNNLVVDIVELFSVANDPDKISESKINYLF